MLKEKILYWFSRPVVGTYTGTMLKMDVRKHELFPRGAKIIAANHPTTTDPFFVASMVKEQSFILINNLVFQVPVLGEYLHHAGHIPVISGRGQEAMDTAVDHLRSGHNIIIFPEGDLSPIEGGFQQARTGVARLALMSGAPVIPVGIHLQADRVRLSRSNVRGQYSDSRFYLRGPYNITTGVPLYFHGDVENRAYVRIVADSVMHRIIELAHESEIRMTKAPELNGAMETM
ncbi:MAG: 1-acyl-sn-glycerol-3-phosphate acyltransferase [Anaerolineaceae bacterium]|nr:1-acyl-sn-glycerol-3-phosphate acyltransferase [Anaerolineaceae bacterium]